MIGAAGRAPLLAAFGLLAALGTAPATAAKPCWADSRSSEGKPAIRDFFSKIPGGSRHVTSNYQIEVFADATAKARSYVTLMGLEEGRPVVGGAGTYEDDLVRIECAWKIRSRKFSPWTSSR